MAGIRICLIADGYFDDFQKCLDSIKKFTDTPISIFASGKENKEAEERFGAKWQKNKLGWGHAINQFMNESPEKYLVIMDPSTTFLGDPIPGDVRETWGGLSRRGLARWAS